MPSTTAPLVVRPAEADDLPFVVSMLDELFAGDPNAMDVAALHDHCSHYPRYVLVAETAKGAAGFILLKDRPSRPWTSCDFVGVAPHAQGSGAGSALVKAGLAASRRPLLRLFVRPTNVAARALYRRLGFLHVSTRKASYDDGEDAMVLMKWAGFGSSS